MRILVLNSLEKDHLLFVSNIRFGGFDSEFKKALDRFSTMGVGCYTIHQGELHHPMRYPNPKMLLAVGVLDEESLELAATYKKLSERLQKAFFVSKARSLVFNKHADTVFLRNG